MGLPQEQDFPALGSTPHHSQYSLTIITNLEMSFNKYKKSKNF